MYNQTRSDQAPWRTAGGNAVQALSQWYGLGGSGGTTGTPAQAQPGMGTPDLSKMPGYQFQLQQGTQAVDRNLAAAGLLNSGAAGKALTQYGQGLAQNYGAQYVNGLQSLAGLGQTSVGQTGAIGANTANQVGANQIYAGNAGAAGQIGVGNAINSGLSGLVGAYGQYNTAAQQQSQLQTGVTNFGNAEAGSAADYVLQNTQPAPIYYGGP